MRNTRLLILLCALVFALALALLRPLPSRADSGDTDLSPGTAPPANTDAIVPSLVPVVHAPPVRRPASVRHKAALRIPLGDKVATFAKHLLGVRYVWGGTSPRTGFDCSGLVRYVYSHFGVALAHSSFAQFGSGRRVLEGALKPGDLVFFHGLGHVGIYIGHGSFIHAPHAGARVRVESLGGWYSGSYDGARRLAAANS